MEIATAEESRGLVVLACDCNERTGPIRRYVEDVSWQPGRLWNIYDRCMVVPNFLSEDVMKAQSLMSMMFEETTHTYAVDSVGVVVVCKSVQESAHVHITFWDKILRGREALCMRLAYLVMDTYGFNVLYTAVPVVAVATKMFARRVGFKLHSMIEGSEVLTFTRWEGSDGT